MRRFFYDKEPFKTCIRAFFLGIPPSACLLLVALVPSNGLGELLKEYAQAEGVLVKLGVALKSTSDLSWKNEVS